MSFEKKSLSQNVKRNNAFKWRGAGFSLLVSLLIAGCATQEPTKPQVEANSSGAAVKQKSKTKKTKPQYKYASTAGQLTERHCLERAIFFEANRTSRAGLVGVGTVVMNRVESSHYPNTVCAVVGQKNQFAPGVLTRPIDMNVIPDVAEAADAVLRGERDPKLKNTMHFHTAGISFPYNNMHYIKVAGGNSFYEKRRRDGSLYNVVDDQPYDVAFALAQDKMGETPASNAINRVVEKQDDTVQLAANESEQRRDLLQSNKAANSQVVTASYKANETDLAQQKDAFIPVPISKANYTSKTLQSEAPQNEQQANATNAAVQQMTNAVGTPHFKHIAAPQYADTGFIRETPANDETTTLSYKAPDADKVGEVGAFLLDNSKS